MRLYRIILDYVPIEKIHAWSVGSDHSEFEKSVLESVKLEGFYNPITTDVRERSYKWDPSMHYISLGNHRYWIAKAIGISHLWCIAKVWNAQKEYKEVRIDQVEVVPIVRAEKDPPWDIRDLEVVDESGTEITGTATEDKAVGQFTGRLLIAPDSETKGPMKLELRNQLRELLG